MSYIPYTYLVLCVPEGKYYYGVRYAKNCNPSDLWSTYFTSSSQVGRLIKKYGKDAFEVQIRKTFIDADDAIKWEKRVIIKMKLHLRNDFYNKTIGQTYRNLSGVHQNTYGMKWYTNGIKDKFYIPGEEPDGWNLGRTTGKRYGADNNFTSLMKDPEHAKRHGEKMKGKLAGTKNPFYGKTHSEEALSKMREKLGKKVECRGIEFMTIIDAAKHFSTSKYLIMKDKTFRFL